MSDEYRPVAPSKPPVRCVRCNSTSVILTNAINPRTREPQWRLTCLDCRVGWPQDQHGGRPDEYM